MLKSLTNRRARPVALCALVLLGLVFLFPQVALAQCAMCRRALQSPEGRQMIAAFRSGTLVLLAAPLGAFATVALLAVRVQRRRAHGAWGRAAPSVNGSTRGDGFRKNIESSWGKFFGLGRSGSLIDEGGLGSGRSEVR